jgi:8-oxo-dGTP pyrophosphatase MutT (NUDIX family)
MPVERSAGAIVYRRSPRGRIEYLLLHYPLLRGKTDDSRKGACPSKVALGDRRGGLPSVAQRAKDGHWDFPKGHIEKGEEKLETVRREVMEETGLAEIQLDPDWHEWFRYFFKKHGQNVMKIVDFYLAESSPEAQVKISSEHLGFVWLPYEKARKKITFDNARQILDKANHWLESRK